MAMPVSCGACGARFQIDESKLPAGKVRLKCPKCAVAIEVQKPDAPGAAAPAAAEMTSPALDAAPAAVPPPAMPAKFRTTDSLPASEPPAAAPAPLDPDARRLLATLNEILKRGIRPEILQAQAAADDDGNRALVCDDEEMFHAILRDQLVGLGYRVDVATTVADALRLVKEHRYEVVTVDNRFPDHNEGGYEILRALSAAGTAARRKIYAVFLSADLKTMDAGSAFFHGANLSINKKDVKRAGALIREGLEEYRRFYRVFNLVQAELLEAG